MSDSNLATRWQQLAQRYSEDQASIRLLWQQIERSYREPQRHYHTLTHLACVFKDLDAAAVTEQTITFAVFYHDIIYRPGSARNEKASARVARRSMKRLGVPTAQIDQVNYMILCTQHHANPLGDNATQCFLDADMAILGVESETYGQYCRAVRREFRRTPDMLFNRGRKRFIKQTLAQQQIYQSDYFFTRYEQQARVNLSDELRRS